MFRNPTAGAGLADWYRDRVAPRLTFELVYGDVALRGRGRERSGPCPLHGGDSPTGLGVNAHTLEWRCRSGTCGGGDALAWLAYRAGLAESGEPLRGPAFAEAARRAGALVGLTPPGPAPSPAEAARLAADAARARERAAERADAARAQELAEAERKRDAARRLWEASEADAAPLVAYLVGRRCWPPASAAARLGLPLTPPRARWAPARELDRLAGRLLGLRAERDPFPADAAGVAVYAFGDPLQALQVDALTAGGGRALGAGGRPWRRDVGALSGSAFRVRGRGGPRTPIALCEGPVTAIALAAAGDVREARASGGAAALLAVATVIATAGEGAVWLVADADPAGRIAAAEAALALDAAGVAVDVERIGGPGSATHDDYADALAARIRDGERRARALGDGDPLAAAWWWETATAADIADEDRALLEALGEGGGT